METDERFRNQFVFFSEDRSEVIIRFERGPDPRFPGGEEAQPRRYLFRGKIHNRIVPVVAAGVTPRDGVGYVYRYDVANQRAARDAIASFSIVGPHGMDRPPMQFGRWRGPSLSYGPARIRQVLLPGLPPGNFLNWVYDTEKGAPIAPARTESGFTVASTYTPGFTTANLAASQRVEWEEAEDDLAPWPDAVGHQVDSVLSWETLDCNVITLGPSFSPGESRQVIAGRLLLAIDQLVAAGAVSPDSPFMAEVLDAVRTVVQGSASVNQIKSRPRTRRESEIVQVVRFSLGISVPSD
jgi:hypothetical protein